MGQGTGSEVKVIDLQTIKQTQRRNVLELLMLSGMSQKEIAEDLKMSLRSVQKHSQKIYTTYEVQDRIQLLARYDLR